MIPSNANVATQRYCGNCTAGTGDACGCPDVLFCHRTDDDHISHTAPPNRAERRRLAAIDRRDGRAYLAAQKEAGR